MPTLHLLPLLGALVTSGDLPAIGGFAPDVGHALGAQLEPAWTVYVEGELVKAAKTAERMLRRYRGEGS